MRAPRIVGATIVAFALVVAGTVPAAAAPRTQTPSTEFCTAFEEQYAIGIVVALASAFASLGDDDDNGSGNGGSGNGGAATGGNSGSDASNPGIIDTDGSGNDGGTDGGGTDGGGGANGGDSDAVKQVRDTLLFVLSPKLERITRRLGADSPDRALGRVFKRQSKIYAKGVELLLDAGVTKKQVEQLAEIDLGSNADADEIIGKAKTSEKKIRRAAREWSDRYASGLEFEDVPKSVEAAFFDAGSACGIFPDASIECDSIIDEADVAAIIGTVESTVTEDGRCAYESGLDAADDSSDTNELKVEVYSSTRAFDDRTKDVENQDVPDLGDEAVALEGLTGFGDLAFSTCGRTLVIRVGERTVLVGACVRDADVDITQLTDFARGVIDKLP